MTRQQKQELAEMREDVILNRCWNKGDRFWGRLDYLTKLEQWERGKGEKS